jgi:hypothetical protein
MRTQAGLADQLFNSQQKAFGENRFVDGRVAAFSQLQATKRTAPASSRSQSILIRRRTRSLSGMGFTVSSIARSERHYFRLPFGDLSEEPSTPLERAAAA